MHTRLNDQEIEIRSADSELGISIANLSSATRQSRRHALIPLGAVPETAMWDYIVDVEFLKTWSHFLQDRLFLLSDMAVETMTLHHY